MFVIILSLTPVHTLFVYVQYPSGSGWWCSSADGLVRWFKTVLSGCWRQVTIKKLKRPCQCKVLTSHTAFKQWHKTDENGDRLHKDGLNIVRDMVYSSKCKTTVFEIQTRNIHDSNPPPPVPRTPKRPSLIVLLWMPTSCTIWQRCFHAWSLCTVLLTSVVISKQLFFLNA